MARSMSMPNVESSASRIAVPARLTAEVESLAGRVGLSRDELVELAIRSVVQGDTAASLWRQYERGPTQTAADVRAALTRAGVREGVRGLRMGPLAADRSPVPWAREGAGVELDWAPTQCWPAVRGLWRLSSDGVQVIVGLRLGRAVGVYKVEGWATDLDSGRKYAVGGRAITADGDLVNAETGTLYGSASESDREIYAAVTKCPIVLSGRHPVVRLSDR